MNIERIPENLIKIFRTNSGTQKRKLSSGYKIRKLDVKKILKKQLDKVILVTSKDLI